MVKDAHCDDITQILVLTDYQIKLTYVSLSFDGTIKFWSDEGIMEQDAEYGGVQFLNGCIIPNQ